MIITIRGVLRDISTTQLYGKSLAIHMNVVEPINKDISDENKRENIFPVTAYNHSLDKLKDSREGDYVEIVCTLYSKEYYNGNRHGYNLRLKLLKIKKIK